MPTSRSALLSDGLRSLARARTVLMRSYEKCSAITTPIAPEDEESLEAFEALTARFARASDILTQKVGKTIILITREDAPTFIDTANVLEKIGAIESAETLITVRDLRNAIAHEYTEEELQDLFDECVRRAPELVSMIDSTAAYATRHADTT